MNKVVSIIFIAILSIFVIILTSVLVVFLKDKKDLNFNFNFSTPSYSETLLDSKEFDTMNDISIDLTAGDISVEESSDEKIVVELYSDYEREYSIKEKDDKIEVVLHTKNNNYSVMQKSDRIIVKIPKEYENKIDANVTTGDINVDKFEKLKLAVEANTGDIEIAQADIVNFKLTTGDIDVEVANKVTGKTTTGDIDIDTVDTLDVTFTTGDISVGKVNKSIQVDGITGDVKAEKITVIENSSISLKTGDVKISSLKGAYIDAKTNVGDTKVDNNDRKSDNEIKITVNIGDIKVNY